MAESLNHAKASLRQQIVPQLRRLTAAQVQADSEQTCERLLGLLVWKRARIVLLFAPLLNEPDVWPLLNEAIAAGKTVALPAFVPGTSVYIARQIIEPLRDLVQGKFGIPEPAPTCPEVPLNRLDLALVPGIAFDVSGGRLGRGKGFYDRLLPAVNGLKCGVAFDEQIVDAVPVGPMDVRLNCIVTPTRWIET
ncbi:MAG TPA: 5-formyltetrahydrofolate cyclo-ligase [Verrucomicrobiae bacterium]|nr:5-formyltetrahydrofolate cyclo-ligase [Verrucomicrobiae bacterium]